MGQKFNVLIIGTGQIGAFNDKPKSANVISHAHAFSQHKGFRLVGFVDEDLKKAQAASKIWGGRSFRNLREALTSSKIDLAVVSTPDITHYSILKRLVNYPLRLVLTEKPLTHDYKTSKMITEIYRRKKIALAVNLTRRFVPEFGKLKKEISKDTFGKFITGTGYYGKGIIHNGIHLIDLLRYLIGELKSSDSYGRIIDYDARDPSISAILSFKNGGKFLLQAVDSRLYSIFEIDLLFEKGRININDALFEARISGVGTNKTFKGFRNLKLKEKLKLSQNKGLSFVADNIYQFLTMGAKLNCESREALKSLKFCEKVRKSLK